MATAQKDLRNVNSLVQKSARIISQIEHKGVHSLCVQIIERVEQFVGGCVIETPGHVDITDTGFQHVRIRYRRLRNSVAHDVDFLYALVSSTLQRELDGRSTRAANLIANFQRRLASHLYAIDFDDSIAITQTGTACGRAIERRSDVSVGLIAANIILNRSADSESTQNADRSSARQILRRS